MGLLATSIRTSGIRQCTKSAPDAFLPLLPANGMQNGLKGRKCLAEWELHFFGRVIVANPHVFRMFFPRRGVKEATFFPKNILIFFRAAVGPGPGEGGGRGPDHGDGAAGGAVVARAVDAGGRAERRRQLVRPRAGRLQPRHRLRGRRRRVRTPVPRPEGRQRQIRA